MATGRDLRPDIAELCRYMHYDPAQYVEFGNRADADDDEGGLNHLAKALSAPAEVNNESVTATAQAVPVAAVAPLVPASSRSQPHSPALAQTSPGPRPAAGRVPHLALRSLLTAASGLPGRRTHVPCQTLIVASLIPGLGSTTLAAYLSRCLQDGASTALVSARADGILPHYFEAMPADRLRTKIEMLSGEEPLAAAIALHRASAQWIVVDSGQTMAEHVGDGLELVPLLPDFRSLAAVLNLPSAAGQDPSLSKTYFVLNQFNETRALHLEFRAALQQHLGEHLLPVAIRHADEVEDALASGLTTFDYAPDVRINQDFRDLVACLTGLFNGRAASAAPGDRR